MPEATESALEAKEKNRNVALIIAVLALLLALAEAGAKNAQHLSTEKNIESSNLFNFYQAKKIRSTVVDTASELLEVQKTALNDPKAQEAFEKQTGSTLSPFIKSLRTAWMRSKIGRMRRLNVGKSRIVDSHTMNSEAV